MELFLVIEDWCDGVTAYPFSTREAAEAAQEQILDAQDKGHRCLDTVWIVERALDAPVPDA